MVDPIEKLLQTVTSRPAQKAYIRTVLATCLAVVLLVFASAGYLLFYLNYVPQIGFATPVQLTYGFVLLYLTTSSREGEGSLHLKRAIHFIALCLELSPLLEGKGLIIVKLLAILILNRGVRPLSHEVS